MAQKLYLHFNIHRIPQPFFLRRPRSRTSCYYNKINYVIACDCKNCPKFFPPRVLMAVRIHSITPDNGGDNKIFILKK